MLEQIKGRSLDELEDLTSGFSREPAGDDLQDDGREIRGDEVGSGVRNDDHSQSRSAGTGGNVIAALK
jgi:hypothetical protein